jgi:hypothetical protein
MVKPEAQGLTLKVQHPTPRKIQLLRQHASAVLHVPQLGIGHMRGGFVYLMSPQCWHFKIMLSLLVP